MKNNQIEEVLFDLYLIDDSLKEYEEDLKDIIQDIYHSKPSTEFNDAFKEDLRNQILLKIQAKKRDNLNKRITLSEDLPNESGFMIFMKKLSVILNTVSITCAVVLVAGYFLLLNDKISIGGFKATPLKETSIAKFFNRNSDEQPKMLKTETNTLTKSGINIKQVENNAFGKIMLAQGIPANVKTYSVITEGAESDYSDVTIINNSVEVTTNNTEDKTQEIINDTISTTETETPTFYVYNYADSIDNLNYNDTNLNVLRRVNDETVDNIYGININNPSFTDIEKFDSAIRTITNDGYVVSYNFKFGELNIEPNPDYVINAPINTTGNDFNLNALKKDIIEAANKFVNNLGLDLSAYGEPILKDNWEIYSSDTEVLYPLIINNKNVYDQFYGDRIGMRVYVNPSTLRVSYLNGYTTQNYESSVYELEHNTATLLREIEFESEDVSYPSSYKKEEIKVDNLEICYSVVNSGDQTLLVPSFILDVEDNNFGLGKQKLVIPLTKDSYTADEVENTATSVEN